MPGTERRSTTWGVAYAHAHRNEGRTIVATFMEKESWCSSRGQMWQLVLHCHIAKACCACMMCAVKNQPISKDRVQELRVVEHRQLMTPSKLREKVRSCTVLTFSSTRKRVQSAEAPAQPSNCTSHEQFEHTTKKCITYAACRCKVQACKYSRNPH